MALQAGTTNLSSLNVQDNATIGGTLGVVGAAAFSGPVTQSGSQTFSGTNTFSAPNTFSGPVTFSGTPTFSSGMIQPVSLFTAAGTVTAPSQIIAFNAAVAGFAVRIPAPVAGYSYDIINQVAASSGNNTITIPAGGTIYQGTISGSVLTFATVGQTARLVALSATQYRSMLPGTMNPALS